ncbi:VirB6/TrbL-like conjugal transfer protein, CD1112 family [Lactococcus lactis]|uniref:VirB6/TrbL-like conjugal transfer protein, CD1112 family n=1 Tax=Lactococcus lactis TaxID=1358 RepID=UPI003D09D855
MDFIFDAINEWIKKILIGAINGNLSTMFGDVNEKVGTIATEVGKTPQGWNGNIFSMVQNLSETIIIPIAGIVITYVLCYELISMITEKNNMHDIDTFMFFKWFFKAWVAVFLVTHTFDLTMAVFDMAQHVVSGAAGIIGGDTNIDVEAALSAMQSGLDAMEIPELLLLVLETSLVSLCMKIMSVLITVILYGRMIEIYLYCSVAPIPIATMTNREWGQIGNNYLKSLLAIGFQGFLMMICVGIYAVLVNDMIVADNLHSAIFSLAAYTVILCFSLFKSGALAKSIFSAH